MFSCLGFAITKKNNEKIIKLWENKKVIKTVIVK